MTDADTRLSMAYWQQSPNCPEHYTKSLELYLEHKDITRVGMSPVNFQALLQKGVAKGKFMGLEPLEAKVLKTKKKAGA